jgi:hypothetical protein
LIKLSYPFLIKIKFCSTCSLPVNALHPILILKLLPIRMIIHPIPANVTFIKSLDLSCHHNRLPTLPNLPLRPQHLHITYGTDSETGAFTPLHSIYSIALYITKHQSKQYYFESFPTSINILTVEHLLSLVLKNGLFGTPFCDLSRLSPTCQAKIFNPKQYKQSSKSNAMVHSSTPPTVLSHNLFP